MKTRFLSILCSILFSACASAISSNAPSVPLPTEAIPASTSTPSLVSLSTASPSATPTPIPATFAPFYASPWADNVALRSNPGYLFPRLGLLKKGENLLVLGRSHGDEWLLVQTPNNQTGWIFIQLVDEHGNEMSSVPYVQPPSVQVVRGEVHNSQGLPISGIQFSFVQGTGNNPPRNDTVRDANGIFYAFMPPTAIGVWTVNYTAVSCTSNTMDTGCNCLNGACGKPYPDLMNVTLPLGNDPPLEFVWR